MIILIHLLQHLGLPAGVAIAVVIAGRKLLKGVTAKTSGRGDRGRGDRRQRRSRVYR